MPIEIPFSGAPRESLSITLAGKNLRLSARYQNFVGYWTLDVFDADQDEPLPLVRGVVVALDTDMLKPYALGLGAIVPRATERPRDEAKLGELGRRVKLIHFSPDEIESD